MAKRFLVKAEQGYVTAEWVNGRMFPECFGYSDDPVMTFTRNRAEMLAELTSNNGIESKIIELL